MSDRILGMFLAVLVTLSIAGPAHSGGDGWSHDVAAALKQAKAEGKDVLMDFTGSDWCGWCIRLNKEVFSQDEFVSAAPKNFVLVELDFPRGKQLSAETKKQNAEWQGKFGVQGYPTIMLVDSEGRPYAKTGYQPGGPEAYLSHLKELQAVRVARDEALGEADKVKGAERAKLLDKALSALKESSLDPGLIMASYSGLTEEIVKADADNSAGLKSKYLSIGRQAKARSLMKGGNHSAAIELCNQTLKEAKETGQVAQDIFLLRSEANYYSGKKDLARKDLDLAIKAAPEGEKVKLINALIKRVFGE